MRKNHGILMAMGLVLAVLLAPLGVRAQTFPAQLKGQIITNSAAIEVPTSPKNFLGVMHKQDKGTFDKDDEGKYTIYFVAFFNRPLPVENMGVVVLDDKKEAIAVADVTGEKGQQSLSSQIVVDNTETPKKKHTLQVYYVVNKKPVILAKKEIVLK